MTPLLKYRACRDARKVTGDGMEVRGGCGYIEEFPEPRLLRDAHLGSIWEGTSNIVALDVIRAARREEGLEAWTHWVEQLVEEAPLDGATQCVARARALTQQALKRDELARSAAAALYNIGTAAAMNWEAKRLGDDARAHLARLVLTHRVLPRDPLDAGATDTAAIAAILASVH